MELLQDYPSVTEIPVAWGEMDALQHVNNVVYFRYFETARLNYFAGLNMMDTLMATGIGPVISTTQCQYKLPVTYPDTLQVGARITSIEEDRFTMEYRIVSQKMGKITTTGEATVVMFDFKQQRKTAIPPALRDAMTAIESASNPTNLSL